MAEVAFTADHRPVTAEKFPKLKLEQDQRARIALLENPHKYYYHALRAPEIENGQPKYTKSTRKGSEGELELYLGFVGQYICMGDEGTLKEKGSDPQNCPLCKAAKEQPDFFNAVETKYALNIIRYALMPGAGNFQIIADPYTVNVQLWMFGDKVFAKLIDMVTENGPITDYDILLGPCTVPRFQTYDIAKGAQAMWRSSEAVAQYTMAMLKSARCEDIKSQVARTDTKWLSKDIQNVQERWAQAKPQQYGQMPAVAAPVGAPSLMEGLAGLGGVAAPAAPAVAPAVPQIEIPGMVPGLAPAAAAPAVPQIGLPGVAMPQAPVAAPAAPAAPTLPNTGLEGFQILASGADGQQVITQTDWAQPQPAMNPSEVTEAHVMSKPGASGETLSMEALMGAQPAAPAAGVPAVGLPVAPPSLPPQAQQPVAQPAPVMATDPAMGGLIEGLANL